MSEDSRLDEIEMRYAFQEDQIRQLDEVVRELGDEVLRLKRELKQLRAQMSELSPEGKPNSLEDEKPPHY